MGLLAAIDRRLMSLDELYFRARLRSADGKLAMFHGGWGSQEALDAICERWSLPGCAMLLDIIATEGVDQFVKHSDSLGGIAFVRVEVAETKATIFLDVDEGEPFWSRKIDYTDLPDGKFIFYFTDEGDHFFMFLPSEY